MHFIPAQQHMSLEQNTDKKSGDIFRRLAVRTSIIVGTRWAFLVAVSIVIVWLTTGPYFHFSDTWQLVINTGTTIITFLMVFLIQNTQNRETKVTQIKLDELLRAIRPARNSLIDIEEATDEKLKTLEQEFKGMREKEERKQEVEPHHIHNKSEPLL